MKKSFTSTIMAMVCLMGLGLMIGPLPAKAEEQKSANTSVVETQTEFPNTNTSDSSASVQQEQNNESVDTELHKKLDYINQLDPSSTEAYQAMQQFATMYMSDTPDPDAGVSSTSSSRRRLARATKPYWQGSSFYMADGTKYLQNAMLVIDVSEHNGVIDWKRVKNSGVQAAIIRIGYGIGNIDKQAARNIAECNRLGIPYGVYLFSYAYDGAFAQGEANWTTSLLQKLNARPTLPIYFDLEDWTWTGHKPPSTPSAYESVVKSYMGTLEYHGLSAEIYSGTYYLWNQLKSDYIWKYVSWVAQYGPKLQFANPFERSFHGWQYSCTGSVAGINSNVDMSAFTPIASQQHWVQVDGKTYYQNADGSYYKGWLDLNGKRYRLDKDDGHLWYGWYMVDDSWYYSQSDGAIVRGWLNQAGATYRLDKDDGHLWTGWYYVGDQKYYAEKSGALVYGWLDLDGKRYRLDRDDGHLWYGWYTVDGRWYYSNNEGWLPYRSGWATIDGRIYYFDSMDGGRHQGWLDLDGKRYRLDKDDGHLWTGWYTADGGWYYAQEDGSIIRTSGWQELQGKTYYFDPETQAIHRGWLDLDGKRYRLDINYGYLWSGNYMADGLWYFANEDGSINYGWVDGRDGKRYRYDINDGHLWIGNFQVDSKWYFARGDGSIAKGWVDGRDGKRYRYDINDGHLWFGRFSVDGKVYYAHNDGSIYNRWQNPAGYYQVSPFNTVLPRAAYSTPFSYVTPNRVSANASRQENVNAFIARAYEYLGTPYRWNYSRQPGVGVDCIGLVYQCAYATGMDMEEFNPYNHYYSGTNGWHSHDANNVWNYGRIRRIPLSRRQPGDLIFWSGHVAIYVGNDQIIEGSMISGRVVRSSLWRYGTPLGCAELFVR